MEYKKNKLFLVFIFLALFLSSCTHDPFGLEGDGSIPARTNVKKVEQTKKVEFTDKYYADYFRNFVAYKPKGWNWNSDTFRASFWRPSIIKFMLTNPKTGGIITLRHGSKKDFGIPSYYNLDEPEIVYESKVVRGGNFDKYDSEYKTKSDCFPRSWMFYYYMDFENVPHNLAVFATFTGELRYFELLSPNEHFQENLTAFKSFIDNMVKTEKLHK